MLVTQVSLPMRVLYYLGMRLPENQMVVLPKLFWALRSRLPYEASCCTTVERMFATTNAGRGLEVGCPSLNSLRQ